MLAVATDWKFTVERGPDWIFVRVSPPLDGTLDEAPLADAVWSILEQSFVYRVVLEMDQVPLLDSHMLGQLMMLSKRVHTHGGLMRVCGLSPRNCEVLHICRLDSCFPAFSNREDAVMGYRPTQPR